MENWDIDQAYAELQKNKSELEIDEDCNEATTRLRKIDTVLFEVLAWEKKFIEAEKYCRATGFADYVLCINNKPCLVIEAKRESIYFVLKDVKYRDTPYTFGLLGKENPEATLALQQAIGYAASLGCRYTAITNGNQWLFALTFVEEQVIEERLVFVFESIEAITQKFRQFWNCFSYEGLQSNKSMEQLLLIRRRPAPSKLSTKITGYPQVASRNIIQNELSYILEVIWQIMSQNEKTKEFLTECYVEPSNNEEMILLAKELIDRRREKDITLSDSHIYGIEDFKNKLNNLVEEKPMVVLGEVGRGKSSFLKYLRLVAAAEQLKNYIQIDIDFIDQPNTSSGVADYIFSEIDRQLKDLYSIDISENNFVRGVLYYDLQRFANSPKGVFYKDNKNEYARIEIEYIEEILKDKSRYFNKVFNHLKKGQNKSIAFFFDNLDRRNVEIQEVAFLQSSAIAREWICLVFICLRPSTFYYSRQNGVLDSIAPKVFTVGHPDIALVLKRRFNYAKELSLGEKQLESWHQVIPNKDFVVKLPKVAQFFELCEFSSRKKRGIIPMLEAVSNGNIRILLDQTESILTAGHLDTKKILQYIEEGNGYYIPDHEGVKTLLYGDYTQYDPSKSVFINLFDIIHSDPREHFLRFGILSFLNRYSENNPSQGYVKLKELKDYLASLGFCTADILVSIEYLYNKKYIRSKVDGISWATDVFEVRINDLGRYHINHLVNFFQYIDAIILDTPIVDNSFESQFNFEDDDIATRIKRTGLFLQYLDNCAKSLNDKNLINEWNEIKLKVEEDILEIIKRTTGSIENDLFADKEINKEA